MAKRTWEATNEPRGDSDTDTADAEANSEMAELAKRLRASNLASEGGASGSAPSAGGTGAGGTGAGGQRTWLRGWAYWWNWSDSAWNEFYVPASL